MNVTTNIIDGTVLLQEIEALKAENERLKQCKRYGLVWEDHPEALDKKNVIPLLKKIDELSLPEITDKKQNYLIEGDNYHALKALQHTHRSAIDVIYIDPPYNTGNEFVYNDKIVDKEDSFRHSKWLSFMEKRLKLARELMSDDGVIFISIDDNEQAQLKLLCDAVFGEANFVANVPRMTSAQRPSQEKYVSIQHDYLLIYRKSESLISFNKIVARNIDKASLNKDHIGQYVVGDTSPILASSTQGYSKGGDYDYSYRGTIYKPVALDGKRRRWLWGIERMIAADKLGLLVPTKNGLRVQNYIDMEFQIKTNIMVPKEPNLILASYDFMGSDYATKLGSKMISNMGILFDFAKPTGLIADLVSLHPNESATVLDFFAGSGTTGHAVMELNKEDGGDRNFILCTNNEVSDNLVRTHFFNEGHIKKNNKAEYNKFVKEHPDVHDAFLISAEYENLGIARAVTRERIKRVIEGYTTPKGKDVEGLPNNLTYLKTKEFDKKEQYGFDRNLLADLAYNSHILKYPELNYESFQVNVFTDIDAIKLTTSKQPVAFVNTRDRESLADIVEQLTNRFGNHVIIETLESYFN